MGQDCGLEWHVCQIAHSRKALCHWVEVAACYQLLPLLPYLERTKNQGSLNTCKGSCARSLAFLELLTTQKTRSKRFSSMLFYVSFLKLLLAQDASEGDSGQTTADNMCSLSIASRFYGKSRFYANAMGKRARQRLIPKQLTACLFLWLLLKVWLCHNT